MWLGAIRVGLLLVLVPTSISASELTAAEEQLREAAKRFSVMEHGSLPEALYCQTCRRVVKALQSYRNAALEAAGHDSPATKAYHLLYHLKQHSPPNGIDVCDKDRFVGDPNYDRFAMSAVCRHVLDWWDWAPEDAVRRSQDPWRAIANLLPRARAAPREPTLLQAEEVALCQVGNDKPPCGWAAELKSEL
jgi:hypothetical protein